jgi:hypothetical protein
MGKNACQSNSIQPQFDCASTALRVQEKNGGWVAGLLGQGPETALTAEQIAAALGLSDPRLVTREIQRERLNGLPICASCGESRGYYLGSQDELSRYVKKLNHRVRTVQRTAEALSRTLDDLQGQERMEEW